MSSSNDVKMQPSDSPIFFDIHGKVRMRVEPNTPTGPQLATMFEPFLTDELDEWNLEVAADHHPLPDASHGEDDYRYTDDGLLLMKQSVQVMRDEGKFRVSGTREMLTSVVPLIDWLMAEHGAGMFHAATFDYKGHGIAMPAWGGVGKTSTIAKLAARPGVSFMGDDWAFLSESADILGFAKPMYIKPHHRPIYPHLFEEKRKPIIPSSLSQQVSSLTTIVHPFVTKYPRLSSLARRWSPEYIMVRPDQAIPGMSVATTSPLAVSVFVERFDGDRVELIETDTSWMTSRLVGNFYAELSHPSRELMTGMTAVGLAPMETLLERKRRIFEAALKNIPCSVLKVPAAWSADAASDAIVSSLFDVIDRAGVGS